MRTRGCLADPDRSTFRRIMFRTKSFQRRILLALLAVSLVPAALLLLMWTVGIQWIVSSVGTAGPWSSVAESGQLLLEAVDTLAIQDPGLEQAARAHEQVLSDGYRLSGYFSLLAGPDPVIQ